jgi:hypothetical protein
MTPPERNSDGLGSGPIYGTIGSTSSSPSVGVPPHQSRPRRVHRSGVAGVERVCRARRGELASPSPGRIVISSRGCVAIVAAMKHRALSVVVLSVFASIGCKPKECDAVIAESGAVQAALGELELTKVKTGADAIAKAYTGHATNEIANLARSAEALSRAIGPMQDRNVAAEDREAIRSGFDMASKNFVDSRTDVRRVCE